MSIKIRHSLLLFLTAVIWGVAFVAQSTGMKYVGPFTFNGIRNTIGGMVLLPYIWLMTINNKNEEIKEKKHDNSKLLIISGLSCGIVFTIASNLQQIAIESTEAGKAGFITAFYIVIVPVLGLFFKRKNPIWVYFSVIIAIIGLFFMCMDFTIEFRGIIPVPVGDFSMGRAEWLLLLSALFFSIHILLIDHFSPLVNGVKLSCIQFFVCGIISSLIMFAVEKPVITDILNAKVPILYAGILSCGVAYTLQIVGQNGVNPTVASLILSLEAVVSVLAGWIILNEHFSSKELAGCTMMFISIIIAQIPGKKKLAEPEKKSSL